MNYLDFHILFIVPPLATLSVLVADHRRERRHRIFQAAWLLALLATLWATPWDNYMVATGVWTYPPDSVVATIGYIPVEEQLFFILQPLSTVCLLGLCRDDELPDGVPADRDRRYFYGYLLAAGVGLLSVGAGILHFRGTAPYLTSIIAWFGPIAALQIAVGSPWLVERARLACGTIVASTTYLSLVDAIAIDQRHWMIVDAKTVGVKISGLPIEEMIFFLVTNTIVIGGALLFLDWYDWLRERCFQPILRRMRG